ncbi:uncharacterized protein LOC125501373 [Athalia rosae]|uniref:uncharacterized protein LOC125501373 n=1 Tax=Athalia rosae TaxID=37344 RepID=UPI00203356E3|nr:uncharacterized protein LOC125501373 [Athalia rosae]
MSVTNEPMETSQMGTTSLPRPNNSNTLANNSDASTLGLNTSKLDLKDYIEVIVDFDGSDGRKVQRFVQYCETIKPLIPAYGDGFLARMLMTEYQLISEFDSIKIRPGEKLINFNFRIGQHMTNTLREIECTGSETADAEKLMTARKAVKAFIRGVPVDIAMVLIDRGFKNLKEVGEEAVKLQAERKEFPQFRKFCNDLMSADQKDCFAIQNSDKNQFNNSNQHNNQIRNKNTYSGIADQKRVGKFCNYCKKNNHSIAECRARPDPNGQQTNYRQNNLHSNLTCNYCKKPGHIIRDCRKRKYNNAKREIENVTRENTQTQKQTENQIPFPRSGVAEEKEQTKLLVDSGSQLNLIKISEIKDETAVDESIKYELNGISKNDKPTTLGQITLRMNNTIGQFHVIPDDFPIEHAGILGSQFMYNNGGNTDYLTRHVTFNGEKIAFSDKESIMLLEKGYVPHLDMRKDILAGAALVTNNNGIAYLYAINTSDNDIKIEVPVVPLYPFDTSVDEDDNPNDTKTAEHKIGIRAQGNRVSDVTNLLRLDHLNSEERRAVDTLIEEYSDLFHIAGEPLKATDTSTHKILTSDNIPVNTRQYRHPPFQKEEIEKQMTNLLEMNIIETSCSPYNSPLRIVPKKEDSQGNKRWRLVIDYRKLNDKTIGDAYPLPLITDILDQLGGAKYFSIFDLASGFHQIKMHPEDKHETAFTTPHGHYEFNRMPFGLKNAPATFQRLMDVVLRGLQGNEFRIYYENTEKYKRIFGISRILS